MSAFRLTVVAFVVGFSASVSAADEDPAGLTGNSFPSRLLERTWVSKITDEALAKSPVWESKNENPPVSARRAMALSQPVVERITKDDNALREWKRRFESATLHKTQDGKRWFWRVEYSWLPKMGGLSGLPPYMDIIVLMDGTVVEPQLEDGGIGK
jgi:hypothetical protein